MSIAYRLFVAISLLTAAVARADVPTNESAVETGGFGAWIIDSLFEAGTLSTMPDQPGMIGAVLIPFSLSCMVVAAAVIVFKSVQHLLIIGQAKDVESSPISMTWAPIHMLVSIALIMPLPSGYSMGQYAAIWLAHQSNTLGNMTAQAAVTTNYGVITQVPLPDVRHATEAIIDAHLCKSIYNAAARYVESNGGTSTEVMPRPMLTRELESVAGLSGPDLSQTPTLSRAGVMFERNRANGGFLNIGPGLGNFCGSVIVEFTTDTENFWSDEGFFSDEPASLPRNDAGQFQSNVDSCTTGPMCVQGRDLTDIENRKQAAVEMFGSAHTKARDVFMNEALSGASAMNAVEKLTYDVPDYFEALLDNQAGDNYVEKQREELDKIERAADATVKMVGNLQTKVYASYATAINTYTANRNGVGDSFRDSVDRIGWPILGLYWFQMSTLNTRILEAVNFRSTSTVNIESKIEQIGALIDDEAFVARMRNRIARYKSAVHNKLLNTRLDDNPGSGGIQSSATNPSVNDAMSHLNNATQAADIKSAFPMFAEELIRSAGKGVINSEEGIMSAIDGFVKGTVFPFLVSPLKTDDNMISGMVSMGHNIIIVSEIGYLAKIAVNAWAEQAVEAAEEDGFVKKSWDAVSNPMSFATDFFLVKVMNSMIGTMINDLVNFVSSMWFFVFLLGLFLAFYVPAIIMIQWLIALVTWMIYIIEAVVVIPLWGILFVAQMGEKAFAPQIAQQGFVHLLSILVYPAFLVIGFIIGLKIVDVASLFLVDFLIIGFLSSTEGFTFGIISLVAGVAVVAIASYQIVLRVFSLMLELHDRAISWIGSKQSFGEGQTEDSARGNVTAVIGKMETKGVGR